MGVVLHAYNPCTQEVRQEQSEYEDSLGYTARPLSKKSKEPGTGGSRL
jgi:hypothetical protein